MRQFSEIETTIGLLINSHKLITLYWCAVFNYSPGAHNVVVVNKAGYDACKTPKGAKKYTSGNDQIKLAKGRNYFICNFVGHCESGTKIAITAV